MDLGHSDDEQGKFSAMALPAKRPDAAPSTGPCGKSFAVYTMGLENFESHPDASGSQMLTEYLRDRHRGKSYGMSTAGRDGQILYDALLAARPGFADFDRFIFLTLGSWTTPRVPGTSGPILVS